MIETYDIVGYARISVDDELDRENTSIENQKAIIGDYVRNHFPGSSLTFYEDRDRSGYTFEQREGYQALRRELIAHRKDILVVKDFSRFSRRNSRGLVELEDLRDAGVRIISIGDGIDFPNDDDWLKIQFQFLLNEMPVTDASRKVRSVIRRRQATGEWLCAAPYGYVLNKRKEFEIVPPDAEVVRTIYSLYIDRGWGYKRIANHLTDQGIPTPRMAEQLRREQDGDECRRRVTNVWSIVSVQGVLSNDFYTGTLRQGKYTRARINGRDIRRDESEQTVIKDHHPAIIDANTFAAARALHQSRTRSHYRGVKKYDNFYTGLLVCGDCGSPLFAFNRKGMGPAYVCGLYHRRGRAVCTAHRTRVDQLDELVKVYVRRLVEHPDGLTERLNGALAAQPAKEKPVQTADYLTRALQDLREELRITKRERIRDLMRHPGEEDILAETYDGMEAELQKKISGMTRQLELLKNRKDILARTQQAAVTAQDIFKQILEKEHLDRGDLDLLVSQIRVYEDHLEVQLKPDVDAFCTPGPTASSICEPAHNAVASP